MNGWMAKFMEEHCEWIHLKEQVNRGISGWLDGLNDRCINQGE